MRDRVLQSPEALAVVGKIYEAALLPEFWPEALTAIGNIIGAYGGAMVVVDRREKTRFVTTDSYRQTYESFLSSGMKYDNNRTVRHLARRHQGFLTDLDTCTQAELDTDPIYSNFLYPFQIGWTVGTVMPVPTSEFLVFDFCHRISDGPFDRTSTAFLDSVRPHLGRAALLSTNLGLQQATVTLQVLAEIGLAAGVLAADARVVACTPQFESLSPRVTIAATDRLVVPSQAAAKMIGVALEQMGSDALVSVRSIPIPASEEGSALILHLVPIRRSARDIFSNSICVIIVTPVTAPSAPLTELLNGLFDLTPAEARVARGIAIGQSITDYANDVGVSRETAKKQLAQVYSKTGTHRQVDLARLLAVASMIPHKT
jgi:DNA-binding CsgD family transcriptional regulator